MLNWRATANGLTLDQQTDTHILTENANLRQYPWRRCQALRVMTGDTQHNLDTCSDLLEGAG